MTRLAAAAEAARYGGVDAGVSDDALIAFATQSNPALLKFFDGYVLRARFTEGHAGVMLCTADRSRALLEDLGCTGELERNFAEKNQLVPCEFTLDVAAVCAPMQTRQ